MTPTLFDRVRLAREGGEVERCHAHPHLLRYSVGHHSHSLVTLIALCWMEDHGGAYPRAELLISAAAHDLPERITGDVPQPVKELLGSKLEVADVLVLNWLGFDCSLTTEEQPYLEFGDKLELYLWCFEEALRGNLIHTSWVDDYDNVFTAAWAAGTMPRSMRVLQSEVRQRAMPRLKWSQLRKIAGL